MTLKVNTRRTPSALAALSTGSLADAAETEVMVEEVEDNASPLSRKHKKIYLLMIRGEIGALITSLV